MKTKGLRDFIYKTILLILLCLYFLLVFGRPDNNSSPLPYHKDISCNTDSPPSLPKLLNFEGISSKKQVKLNWEFETTDGLDECLVERADKSGDFEPVAYFFMTEDIHIPILRYTDNVPKSKTYFYRLRLTGKGGNREYTRPLTFEVGSKQNQKKSLIYPSIIL